MATWGRTLLMLLLVLALPREAHSQAPPELQPADALARGVEEAERWGEAVPEIRDLDLDIIEDELARVRGYLERHSDDSFARVLLVRLARIRAAVAFQSAFLAALERPALSLPDPPSYEESLAILDDVIARDSSMAVARYWRARLMLEEDSRRVKAASPPYEMVYAGPVTTHLAVDHARAGVELDPDNRIHREFLGFVLAQDSRFEEAVDGLDHPTTRGGVMHSLLQDLATFRPPPDADADDMLLGFAFMLWGMGTAGGWDRELAGYRESRVMAWSVEATAEEVIAHYRARWPEADFSGWQGDYVTRFVFSDGGWHVGPPFVPDEAVLLPARDEVVVLVTTPETFQELRASALEAGMPGEVALPGTRAGIMYLNLRRRPLSAVAAQLELPSTRSGRTASR